jgi:MerR family mercuric resistance operon transcriptional regulator
MPERLTIGGLAKQAGVGVETVRFYQRLGILRQPRKPVRGNRSYSSEDVAQLRFVRACKGLGLSLKDIARITRSMAESPEVRCHEVHAIFRDLAAALEAERRMVEARQEAVARLLKECADGTTMERCRLLGSIHDGEGAR